MKGALLVSSASADIHAWGADRLLKLFRPEFADTMSLEAARSRAIHAAGLPSPAIYETVEIDGRPGIVMQRLKGATLLSELARGPASAGPVAARLAAIQIGLHQIDLHQIDLHRTGPPELPRALDTLQRSLEGAAPELRERLAPIVAALPDGDAVCHGDLHPGNVILTPDGPVLVDWVNAHLGHPALDVARSLILLRYQSAPRPGRGARSSERLALRQALADAYLEAILDAGHVTQAELSRALAWAASTLLHAGAFQESDRGALEALAAGPGSG